MRLTRTMLPLLLTLVACGDNDAETPKNAPAKTPPAKAAKAAPAKAAPTQNATAKSAPDAPKQEGITQANWKSHPEIVEVRELVEQIQSAMGGGGWTTDRQKFSDGCAEQGVYEVTLNSQMGSTYVFTEEGGMGDISRTTTHYYDESGQARFVMSEYTHGSAESKMVSRMYLAEDGKVLFAPKPEQASKKSGPTDDMSIKDLLLAKSSDAKARHAKLVQDCKQ